jgi:hypothetical protein
MGLRQRLQKLEKAHPPNGPGLWIACVDEEGRILDDGSRATRPWVGKHYHDVPRGVATVIGGVDPLIVLGLQANGEAFGTTNEIAATTSEG